jgi:CyaY protein
MDDREFQDRVDGLFNDIEDQIDELEKDIDVDSTAGMLAIEMPDGSNVVLSRQIANHEIWVAARSGGFHLSHTGGFWVCGTNDEKLSELLNRVFAEQLGEPFDGFDLTQ